MPGGAVVSLAMGAPAPVRLARQLIWDARSSHAVRPAEPVEPIFDILGRVRHDS